MGQQNKDRCIYCGSDVYYTGTELLIKCSLCGHTLVVAKFENELARMNQALEEKAQAMHDLEAAEQAKKEAEERLYETLDSFDAIQDRQDVLSQLIRSVMAGQETAEEKLFRLQCLGERILKNQGDFFEGMNIIGEIRDQLRVIGMDARASQAFARDFMSWFQDIHEEDRARLEKTVTQTSELLSGQKEINDRIGMLQDSADKTQKTLDEFHGQWKESQLEELRQLYHQAENYQYDRAYDKAYDKYEQIVTKGGADAEIIWRMLLCHYCVSYQKPDEEGRDLVPIILNPDLTAAEDMSIRQDLAAHMKDATPEQKAVYVHELGKIDRILDKYRLIRGDVAYDVFISVRQQRGGNPTKDSFAAVTLYNTLTSKGLKVFNSRLTPPPAGQEFEPYIISALMSAKAMIVVGTSRENMETQWVKNEWSRFQWLQYNEKKKTGRTDRVLLCYLAAGMKPEEIPRGLNPSRQAIVDGIAADKQLEQALGFLLQQKNGQPGMNHPAVDNSSEEQVVSQMTTWLFRKKFNKVIEKYEALNDSGLFLDRAQVHLCALCAEKGVTSIDEIVESKTDLGKEPLFLLAMKVSQGTDEYDELNSKLEKNAVWRKEHSLGFRTAPGKKQKEKEVKPETKEQPEPETDPSQTEVQGEQGKGPAVVSGQKKKNLPGLLIGAGVLLLIFAIWMSTRGGGTGSDTQKTGGTTPSSTAAAVRSTEQRSTSGEDKSVVSDPDDHVMDWRDENLEKAMREITGITDRDIKFSDVKGITELDLNGWQIRDISALAELTQLEVLNLDENEITDINVLAELTKLNELSFSRNQVSDISALADLTNLTDLKMGENQLSDISALAELKKLKTLIIWDNQIADISILSEMADLEVLGINTNKISDISALKSLTKLTYLNVHENPIGDISALSGMKELIELHAEQNEISDISPLAGMTKLEILDLDQNNISDISVLAGMTKLKRLYIWGNQISDISSLANLTELEVLDLGTNQIEDISILEGLTALKDLYIGTNQFTDISSLKNLTGLTRLRIEENQISDISVLAGMTRLTYLNAHENHISDISVLAGMTKMKTLYIWGNQISDISILANLTELEVLDLGSNQISNISSLKNLTKLTDLRMGENQISDISVLDGLTKLKTLYIWGNQITDISVLSGMTDLEDLSMGTNKISDISSLKNLTKLTDLRMGENQISDISVLEGMTKLKILYMWENQITDISVLSEMTDLEELSIGKNQISDISSLKNLTKLTDLRMAENQISDISALEGMTKLKILYIWHNQISDISALSGMTDLEDLSMSENEISDISALSGMTKLYDLYAHTNHIKDLSPLAGLTELTELYLGRNEISDISALSGLTKLKKLYITENPVTDFSPIDGLEIEDLQK